MMMARWEHRVSVGLQMAALFSVTGLTVFIRKLHDWKIETFGFIGCYKRNYDYFDAFKSGNLVFAKCPALVKGNSFLPGPTRQQIFLSTKHTALGDVLIVDC